MAKDHPQAYELGENESHICFVVDDYEAYHQLHQDMGCICLKMKQWDFILFMILMITGWKLYHKNEQRTFVQKVLFIREFQMSDFDG